MKKNIFSTVLFFATLTGLANAQAVTSNVNGVSTTMTADDAGTTSLLVASTMNKDLALGTRGNNGFWYSRMWVKFESGNVGINTNTPSHLLHVNGNLRVETDFSMGGAQPFSIDAPSIPAGRFTVQGSGNVGIGTPAPEIKLDVRGAGSKIGLINSAVWDHIYFEHDGNTAFVRAGGAENGLSLRVGSGSGSYGMQNYIEAMRLLPNGNVGIGTALPGSYKLAVEGSIGAREVEVKTGAWADFVFNNNYTLKPLQEVEAFIQQHKHLPDVPSEATVLEKGINLGKMDALLLQKIEELTLYLIKQEKRLNALEKENALLKQLNNQ